MQMRCGCGDRRRTNACAFETSLGPSRSTKNLAPRPLNVPPLASAQIPSAGVVFQWQPDDLRGAAARETSPTPYGFDLPDPVQPKKEMRSTGRRSRLELEEHDLLGRTRSRCLAAWIPGYRHVQASRITSFNSSNRLVLAKEVSDSATSRCQGNVEINVLSP